MSVMKFKISQRHGPDCAHNYDIQEAITNLPRQNGVLVRDTTGKYHVVHQNCAPVEKFPRVFPVDFRE